MIDATITNSATTFTIGSCAGRERVAKIQIGSVCCAPDVKIVTTTSSNDSANASRPPARSAVRICGNITYRNVCQESAPRSADASSSVAAQSAACARSTLL